MSVSPAAIPRRVVGGISVLLYPNGPYLDVAERVRIVHATRHALSVERGEVLQVRPSCWIYRTTVLVGEHQYIGDAEVHRYADPTSPDGTNPISCAQTSAIGQALEFAGFGDLKSALLRLQQPMDLAALGEMFVTDEGQEIEGSATILLGHTPYVTVAERLFHLHRSGTSLSMEGCEILDLAGVWVYRTTVLIGNRRYLGDAEIFFDAAPGTPDATHPVSCAQISAVGNALALAGFGDVRSILERLGKDVQTIDTPPQLSSADAVLRARRQGQVARSVDPDRRITPDQREQIAALCQRLGAREPAYETLDVVEADQLIARLQTEQEELLRSAEEARRTPAQNPPEEQGAPAGSVVDPALVRQLKKRWRDVFRPAGDAPAQVTAWEAFKTRVCGKAVVDASMSAAEYEQVLAAIPSPTPQRSSSPHSPVRQAPRLASPSPTTQRRR